MEGELKGSQIMQEKLKEAAKPLVDFLYKYYHPHATIIVTQGHVEVLEGTLATVNDLRD